VKTWKNLVLKVASHPKCDHCGKKNYDGKIDLNTPVFFFFYINFPCSESGLRIEENDVIFSKISHGLKL